LETLSFLKLSSLDPRPSAEDNKVLIKNIFTLLSQSLKKIFKAITKLTTKINLTTIKGFKQFLQRIFRYLENV